MFGWPNVKTSPLKNVLSFPPWYRKDCDWEVIWSGTVPMNKFLHWTSAFQVNLQLIFHLFSRCFVTQRKVKLKHYWPVLDYITATFSILQGCPAMLRMPLTTHWAKLWLILFLKLPLKRQITEYLGWISVRLN